jgi:hypothetical protein
LNTERESGEGGQIDDSFPTAKAIAEEAVAFFQRDDIYAFKKSDNGIYLIIPNASLLEINKIARSFHAKIIHDGKYNTEIMNLFIGLTSRAGRQIKSELLVLETDRAVAIAEGSPLQPIVAFQVDPLKYNELTREK